MAGQVGRIDDLGALALHLGQALLHQPVDLAIVAEEFPRYSNACAAQAQRIQVRRVVRGRGRQSAQQDGGVGDGAGHGTGGVLAVSDGNDTRAADQAQGWLDPDDPVGCGGRDDGAIGFGAHRERAQVGGYGRGRS